MFTFLPGLLRPSQEGALHLHPIERAPEAFMNRASPVQGGFIGFLCKPRNISLFISPLLSYPSTRDHQSGPLKDLLLGSIKGPLKDPNNRIGEKKISGYSSIELLQDLVLLHLLCLEPSNNQFCILSKDFNCNWLKK